MVNLRALSFSAVIVAGMGCESAATYVPKQSPQSVGYSDERLADNRFRVTFSGNSATARETVENFLLLRAAEVTQ